MEEIDHHHHLDTGVLVAFSVPWDGDTHCGKYWGEKDNYDFTTSHFVVDKELRPIIDGCRGDMLYLVKEIDQEFDIGNINSLQADLKSFTKAKLDNPKSPIIDFIEENESFFRSFVLDAKDMRDLRRKVEKEFERPRKFVQELLSNDHELIETIEILPKKSQYETTISEVQEVIQHEKEKDNLIYVGAIMTADEKGLDRCYFSTTDQDEFGNKNTEEGKSIRQELKEIDDRIEIFVPRENFDI